MLFPELTELGRSQDYTQEFRGYNHNPRIADGEFWNMRNLSSDAYPVVRPAKKRTAVYTAQNGIRGVYVKGGHLIYVSGNTVYIDGQSTGIIATGGTAEVCTIVGMGTYLVFFPGGEYFDLVAYLAGGDYDHGTIDNQTEVSCGVTDPDTGDIPIVFFRPCMADGTTYEDFAYSEPENPTGGLLWVDTTGETPVAKIYDAERSMWVIVTQMYVKIEGTGIGKGFSKADGVKISGALIEDTTGEYKKVVNGSFTLTDVGDDWLIIPGLLPAIMRQTTGTITVKRQMPKMDYVVECQNRLWGCKHGQVYVDGKKTFVNEIYASALGDFKNWSKYEGLSTDSYTASRGSDGEWTGAIVYGGNPMFFKADMVDIVSVSSTGGHQISTRQVRGPVKKAGYGSTIAIVDDVLYWTNRKEVVVYNGTYPETISAPLGIEAFGGVVAGALGHKYYLVADGILYVYDAQSGMWHKEGDFHATLSAWDSSGLYFMGDGTVWAMATGDRDQEWMAETGNIGLSLPGRKYVSRIMLRMAAPRGAYVDVYVMYDSDCRWQKRGRMTGSSTLKSKLFPVIPRRCDHMKIRLVGKGDVQLYSLGKIVETGSDYL